MTSLEFSFTTNEPLSQTQRKTGNDGANAELNDDVSSLSNSSQLRFNPNLTPVKPLSVQSKYYERKELTDTLKKAKLGQTLLPEKLNDGYHYLNIATTKDNKDMNKENAESSSTPTSFSILQSTPSSSRKDLNLIFNSTGSTRKGVSESFVNSQPGLKNSTDSKGNLNPVKGAYNIFDKRKKLSTPGRFNSSPMDLLKRKRRRSDSSPLRRLNDNRPNKQEPTDEYMNANTDLKPTTNNNINDNKKLSNKKKSLEDSSSYKLIERILTDPQTPANLTSIIQILLNTLIFSTILLTILFSFLTVKKDADKKIQSYSNALQMEINSCKREYFRNNCSPDLRVPALEESCTSWENCMNKDSSEVVTTTAYFEILADCLNAFFHKLSFRSLFGLSICIAICFVVPNFIFNKVRSNTSNTSNTTTMNYYNFTNEKTGNDTVGSPRSPSRIANGTNHNGSFISSPQHQSSIPNVEGINTILTSTSPMKSPLKLIDQTIYFTPPQPIFRSPLRNGNRQSGKDITGQLSVIESESDKSNQNQDDYYRNEDGMLMKTPAGKDSESLKSGAGGSSVRFNPNVSYRSVYEFENAAEKSPLATRSFGIVNRDKY